LTVLNLDTGFKLGKIKEVPAVYWQILDLGRSEYALHRGLDSIDLEIGSRNVDCL
jgi:hypothetical protein